MTDDLAAEGEPLHALAWRVRHIADDVRSRQDRDDLRAIADALAAALRERDTAVETTHRAIEERDAALRTIDEREAYAATRDERITELLRERDDLRDEVVTDRTNLDVAAGAIAGVDPLHHVCDMCRHNARAALNAIDPEKHRLADKTPEEIAHLLDLLDRNPALADLTPDDVRHAFYLAAAHIANHPSLEGQGPVERHLWQVLSR